MAKLETAYTVFGRITRAGLAIIIL